MSLDMEETPDLDFLAKNEFIGVKAGGKWQPESCVEPRTVAVVIPFRDVHGDRTRNLKYLVMQLHHILQRHMLKYVIIVAQQVGIHYVLHVQLPSKPLLWVIINI